jgi:uncharacterized protein YutD
MILLMRYLETREHVYEYLSRGVQYFIVRRVWERGERG